LVALCAAGRPARRGRRSSSPTRRSGRRRAGPCSTRHTGRAWPCTAPA